MKMSEKDKWPITGVEMHTFVFWPLDERMYILLCGDECLVVDPHINLDAIELIKNRGISDIRIILTHEHADHISGLNWLRDQFSCIVIATDECAAAIPNPKDNLSQFNSFLLQAAAERTGEDTSNVRFDMISCYADVTFKHEYSLTFGQYTIRLYSAAGHSRGSLIMAIEDTEQQVLCIFTGDNLMMDYAVTTRLPGGSKKSYESITIPLLKSFDSNVWVYPGHGRPATIQDMMYGRE